ncbi:MAG: glycoside hydrolase family 9 protein, partial [Balneolaceae bacterium]
TDQTYRNSALDQLHYVLGRNPFDKSQVTGVGTRSVQDPYHQLSKKDGYDEPVPGMLVGGPNNHLLLEDREISPYPGKNYEDRFRNYLVNEVAINFTAVLAYVAGSFVQPDELNLSPLVCK